MKSGGERQQERSEMSVIKCEIWLWKREEVCEGVGKQEGCDEREMRLWMFVWPCTLYLCKSVFDGDNSSNSASVTDILPANSHGAFV